MDPMQERRMDLRFLCADLVELIWFDSAGKERRRIGNLEDISASGMCLQLEAPLRTGTKIRILYGSGELVGVVRHASMRDEAYFIGVKFDDSSRWSASEFRPQHLLDPEDLSQQLLLQRLDMKSVRFIH